MYLTKRFNAFNENVKPFWVMGAMLLDGLYYYYRVNKELVMRCGVIFNNLSFIFKCKK